MTVQQAQPAAAPETVDRRRMNLVFATVLLGMLLSALDQTIVSTALPTIVGDLGGAGHLSWVVSSYLLADTIATVLAGKFGDLFGRKLRLPGLRRRPSCVASALCGLAQDMTWLIALARGAGLRRRRADGHRDGADRRRHPAAGARQVPGRARRGVRRHHRARPAARRPVHRPPVLAVGVLRQRADRRSSSSSWPRSPSRASGRGLRPGHRLPGHRVRLARRRRADPGPVLGRHPVRVGLGDHHRAVRRLAGLRWRSSSFVERRAADPILPLRLFRSPVFSVCVVLAFIVGFAMLGAMTFLPTYLQYVNGVVGHRAPGCRRCRWCSACWSPRSPPARRRPHRPVQDLPDRRRGWSWRSACSCCR